MAWTTPRTWVTSEVPTAAIFNTHVRDNLNYLKGTSAAYTPQLDQGVTTNITKTVTEARYIQTGDVCDLWVQLTITGIGTLASNLTMTLPLTAIGYASQTVIGSGYLNDADVQSYNVAVAMNSATTVVFRPYALGGYFGSNPSVGVANGDILSVNCRFLVA